jgi:predicted Zn-dependent protease
VSERLTQLETFVREKPDDPFPRYALALELKGLGRSDDALAQFAELVKRSPDYVPAYLMYGTYLTQLGKTAEAKAVLEKGVERARAKGNMHALGEIQDALGGLD